jgi:hypothetical protein
MIGPFLPPCRRVLEPPLQQLVSVGTCQEGVYLLVPPLASRFGG